MYVVRSSLDVTVWGMLGNGLTIFHIARSGLFGWSGITQLNLRGTTVRLGFAMALLQQIMGLWMALIKIGLTLEVSCHDMVSTSDGDSLTHASFFMVWVH